MNAEEQATAFTNARNLGLWLHGQGIDLSAWGNGKNKSVDNLWQEIVAHDCRLLAGPKRMVEMAVIIVEAKSKVLCEAKQEFRDGRTRIRNKPPGEKMQTGETVRETVFRCVKQELRIRQNAFRIAKIYDTPVSAIKESDSYPGLTTEYAQHYAKVFIPSLPLNDFSTEELGDAHDPVRRHWWTWKDRKELTLPPFI